MIPKTDTVLCELPSRVQIPPEKCMDNWKESQAMVDYIVKKCKPMNPSIFDDKVIQNWRSWLLNEQEMWCHTDKFVSSLDDFCWPSPWALRQKHGQPHSCERSEQLDFEPNQQIICHESGEFGQFSKADRNAMAMSSSINENALRHCEVVAGTFVIFKWIDDNDNDSGKQYLWLAQVISVTEGSPVSPDCKLLVRWCPNDRRRTWRTKLTVDDIFDTKYTTHLRQKPYRDTINKANCIALNLRLTASGKLDNRHKFEDGSTSKDVAECALKEFYSTN